MRKYLYLSFLLLLFNWAFAQNTVKWQPKEQNPLNLPTDEQGELRFREIVPIPKVANATAIKRARAWAANIYPSANEMVQTFDTTSGLMIVKGVISPKQGGSIGHKLFIEAKEGRYRATFSDLAYIYEITTPVKLKREMIIHPYGCDADDYYNMYLYVTTTTGANMGFASYKRMAATTADKQGPILAEVKRSFESMLISLKKAIEGEAGW